jgi:hypothetical protein
MASGHTGRTLAATGLAGAEPAALRWLARLDTAQLAWPYAVTAAGERTGLVPEAGLHQTAGILARAADRALPGYCRG